MIADQLRQLLLEHDCVTLPGFGGLLAEVVPARVHPVRFTLAPPARRVVFNEKLSHDDGLLTEAVRRTLNPTNLPSPVGLEPARAQVRTFTDELRASLRQHRAAELPGLGTLRRATEAEPIRLELAPPGYLPLVTAFGLPELVARPVLDTAWAERGTRTSATRANSSQPMLTRLRTALGTGSQPFYRLATAAVVVLSFTATYLNARLTPLDSGLIFPAEPLPAVVASRPEPGGQLASIAPALPPAPVATPRPKPVAAAQAVGAVVRHEVATSRGVAAPKPARIAPVAVAPVAPKVAAAAVVTPVAPVAATKAASGHFYLVWNAFSSQAKAEKGRALAAKMGGEGAAPQVLAPPVGSALYRVVVGDYDSMAAATAALSAARTHYGAAVWVLRN